MFVCFGNWGSEFQFYTFHDYQRQNKDYVVLLSYDNLILIN